MTKKKAEQIKDIPEAEITNEQQAPRSEKVGKKIEVKARARKKSDFAIPLVADLIMLIVGTIMLMYPETILNTISIIIGVIFIVYAAYNIIKYVRLEEKHNSDMPLLITGIAVAIAGCFLIVQSGFIEAFFSILIGIILTVSSIIHLQDALSYKDENKTPFILSIITLVCGILCLFGKLMPIRIMVCFVGVIMLIYSLADIVLTAMVYKKK